MIVLLSGSLILFFVLGNDSVLGNPIGRNVASLSFCVLTLLTLSRVRVGNRVSNYLGKCSYEIFLIHPFVQRLVDEVLEYSHLVYGILVISITLLAAGLMSWMTDRIGFYKEKTGKSCT